MKQIIFLCIILLGSMIPLHAQTVWSLEQDTVYLNQSDEGRQVIIEYGIACFQCSMPDRVILLDIHPSLTDSTLNQYVSMELLTPDILGQRLLDSLYDHMYQKISYRVTFKKVLPRRVTRLIVTLDVKLERRAVVFADEYYSPRVINAKTIVMNPPLVEFYPNPDSTNRMIPTFVGMKNVLIGSYVLKNNHPTKKMNVSFVGLGFKDTSTWQYFAGVGQTETIPSEVGPKDSIMFNFWIQLKLLTPGTDITMILYLKCWYDDTLLSVSAQSQSMQTEPVMVSMQKIEKIISNFYPNPCTNYLMVSGAEEKPEVFNILGQKMEVLIDKINNDQWKINTDLLPNGFYFINGKKFFKQ